MKTVKITILLNAEALGVFGRLAAKAGMPTEEFVSCMLALHFEICAALWRMEKSGFKLSMN